MKAIAIIRRAHKYITGGSRFFAAAKRWCPNPVNSVTVYTLTELDQHQRNRRRLLRLAGVVVQDQS